MQGETTRKATTFYLAAAAHGGIPLSQWFKMPRPGGGGSSGGTRRTSSTSRTRARGARGGAKQTPPPAPSVSGQEALRTRYIEMLMKKAESQDEMDDKLLDRIEAQLGSVLGAPSEEGEDELLEDQ